MTITTPFARVNRNQYNHFVGPDISPAIEINSGQEVIVETMDCFSNAITDNAQRFNTIEDYIKMSRGPLPVAGPIAINGAVRGGKSTACDGYALHSSKFHLDYREDKRTSPPDN